MDEESLSLSSTSLLIKHGQVSIGTPCLGFFERMRKTNVSLKLESLKIGALQIGVLKMKL